MASVGLKAPTQFPPGLTVGAYPDHGTHPSGAPTETALETQTIDTSSVLTFTSLAEGRSYWAGGQVGGAWAYFGFSVPVPGQVDVDALVTHEPLNVRNAPYSAANDDTGDQAAAINAGLTTAGNALGGRGGTVYVPSGKYRCPTASLSVPRDKPVNLIGDGPNNTIIHFPNDLGAGTYEIAASGSEAGMRHRFEDFRVEGPNPGAGPGVIPAAMGGIFAGSNNRFTRVASNGAKSGVDVQGDHTHLYDCDLGGYYGLLFGDSGATITARGSSVVEGCDLSGATYASLAVTTANGIEGGSFINTHFGFGPYGIAIVDNPAVRTIATPVNSCSFYDCAFEQIGNAVIFSNAGAGFGSVSGNRFFGCGTSPRAPAYQMAGEKGYAVDVESFDDTVIDGGAGSGGTGAFLSSAFDTGTIRFSNTMARMEWRAADGALTNANGTGKPLFTGQQGNGSFRTSQVICGIFRADAAYTPAQGDLTEAHTVSGIVKKFGTVTTIPIGVAAAGGLANNLFPVAIGGKVPFAKADAGTAALVYLKPSATAGKLTTAAVTDQPRVGWSETAESGGYATVRLCPPATWAN